jgi:hypothetical protein
MGFAAVTRIAVRYRAQSEPVRAASCLRPACASSFQQSITLIDGFEINV